MNKFDSYYYEYYRNEINKAHKIGELDKIIEQCANDDNISSSEYIELYGLALAKLQL